VLLVGNTSTTLTKQSKKMQRLIKPSPTQKVYKNQSGESFKDGRLPLERGPPVLAVKRKGVQKEEEKIGGFLCASNL
jgi:hypothetical protein